MNLIPTSFVIGKFSMLLADVSSADVTFCPLSA